MRYKYEKALARFSVERALYTFHVFEYDSFHGWWRYAGFFIVLFCVCYVPSSFRVLGTLLLSWVSEVVAKWCVLVCVFERVLSTVCGAIRSQSDVFLRVFERGFGNGLRCNWASEGAQSDVFLRVLELFFF